MEAKKCNVCGEDITEEKLEKEKAYAVYFSGEAIGVIHSGCWDKVKKACEEDDTVFLKNGKYDVGTIDIPVEPKKPLFNNDFWFYLTKHNAGNIFTKKEIEKAVNEAILDFMKYRAVHKE